MFSLAKGLEIIESADNGPGRLGGDNGHGVFLPSIIYGLPIPPSIDMSLGKVQGSNPGPVGRESEDLCPTDSSEDQPGYDDHKLVQIAHAIHKQESVTVCLKGHFKGYENEESVCHFQREHVGPPPSSLEDLFQAAFNEIKALAPTLSFSGIPGSLFWTIVPFTGDALDIVIVKVGKGIRVDFERKGMPGPPINQFPAAYTIELLGNWFISFGAEEQASDMTLMQYFMNITAPWDGVKYGQPWRILLTGQPWRRSDTGEILLAAASAYPQDVNPNAVNPRIPINAAQPRTSYVAARPKEIGNLLKFGRDSDWPLFISVASTLDGSNSATVTSDRSVRCSGC
jgi:hypothetical protein